MGVAGTTDDAAGSDARTSTTARTSSTTRWTREAARAAHRERGTVRPITVVGNPVLHRECADVTEFDDELAALVDDMFASQRAAEGVGLAANQIGVDLQGLRLRLPGRRRRPPRRRTSCNPVLDELPADQRTWTTPTRAASRCPARTRSWPARTTRWCAARTRDGNPIVVEGTGYFARCLQHETDHLYGHLYIDRLSKRDRKDVLRQMAEGTPPYETVPND